MFNPTAAFNGFSVDDLAKAKAFYNETLGLNVTEEVVAGLRISLPGGHTAFAYPKDDHRPATFTILYFVVDDIDEAVDELAARGVTFERYDNLPAPQDQKGILRGLAVKQGPDIAWFKDPAGNILGVEQINP
jgi:catechol 2,3-dioxygenase-like lactoylglutathione lyase family enzyme